MTSFVRALPQLMLAALVLAVVGCGPRHKFSHVRAPSAPASGPAPASAAAADPSLDRARDLCVSEINKYRATLGLPPVQRWHATEVCTDDEARRDGISQTAHGAFGSCQEWEQCECPGWDGPPDTLIVDCLRAMWDEGPGGGHHDAMANPENHFVSCGFHAAADGSIWAIQNYTGAL